MSDGFTLTQSRLDKQVSGKRGGPRQARGGLYNKDNYKKPDYVGGMRSDQPEKEGD